MTLAVHDSIVKKILGDPARAAALLRRALPANVAAAVDFDALRAAPTEYVDALLAQSRSDLLFETRIGERRGLVFLLVEHQSDPDRMMPWRSLKYMVRVWDRVLAEAVEIEKLPAIVPVVLHHGERGFSKPRRMQDLVDLGGVAELSRHVPESELVVEDLRDRTDEQLRDRSADAEAAVTLWLLRDGRNARKLETGMQQWSRELREVYEGREVSEAGEAILSYILEVAGQPSLEQVAGIVKAAAGEKAGEAMMTLGERLRHEGRVAGEAKGKAEAVMEVLELRGIELTPEQRQRVVGCQDSDLLRIWHRRAVTATTADDVFDQ